MRHIGLIAMLIVLAGCDSSGITAEKVEQGWTDDLAAAKTRAKAENKFVYVLFTGHTW